MEYFTDNIRGLTQSLVKSVDSRLPNARFLSQLPLLSIPWLAGESMNVDDTQQCPGSQLSCQPGTAPQPDTCCVNHPSGLFMQTQFWDTSPSIGPRESWTIHGLWPDLCTGGFDAYCDKNRVYNNISEILESHGAVDTLEYMKTYWLSDNGNDEHLWAHEWNKHGTCISTLASSCYSPQSPFHDVLDYFTHTTALFDNLNTYDALATANIYPSARTTYNLADLLAPLELLHTHPVVLRCNQHHELNEVWYFFNTQGSLRNATSSAQSGSIAPFIPTDSNGQTSNCPAHGIKYQPKGPHNPLPRPSTTHTHPSSTRTNHPSPTSSSQPFTGRGHLAVHLAPSSDLPSERMGCLIRSGEWYTSGGCAIYTAQPDVVDPNKQQLFSLASRYAPCAIGHAAEQGEADVPDGAGRFQCAKDLGVQGIFSGAGVQGDVLAYRNGTRFWAERVPQKFGREGVFVLDGDGMEDRGVEIEVRWEGI